MENRYLLQCQMGKRASIQAAWKLWISAFYEAFEAQWTLENKPFGFDQEAAEDGSILMTWSKIVTPGFI